MHESKYMAAPEALSKLQLALFSSIKFQAAAVAMKSSPKQKA